MQLYTETTDGSYIELKESAIVWHYQYADHDYGSCQATELLDHLESVLTNEPVVVKRGQHIVEVKPQVHTFVAEDMFVLFLGYFLIALPGINNMFLRRELVRGWLWRILLGL